MIPKDLVLEDDRVRLEPLDFTHARDLHEAGSDEEIWRTSYRVNAMQSIAGTCRYIGKLNVTLWPRNANSKVRKAFAVPDFACDKPV